MGVNKVVYGAVEIINISDSTVTPETLVKNTMAYGADGEVVEGSNPYELNSTNNEVNTQADLIAQISTVLEGKAGNGGSITPTGTKQITTNGTHDVTTYAKAEVNVPSKEPVTDELNVTVNGTYTPASGVDGYSKVTVNVPTSSTPEAVEQATPSITVSSSGLITASATQTSGYVEAGTKEATKQLTTQSAKTVTPGKTNQTAVASGVYTTGAVTVKGDTNLVAANIRRGVSIFGVTGSYAGSGDISYDTCKIDVITNHSSDTYDTVEYYTTISGGEPSAMTSFGSGKKNILCGSTIAILAASAGSELSCSTSDGILLMSESIDEVGYYCFFLFINLSPGETGTITIG